MFELDEYVDLVCVGKAQVCARFSKKKLNQDRISFTNFYSNFIIVCRCSFVEILKGKFMIPTKARPITNTDYLSDELQGQHIFNIGGVGACLHFKYLMELHVTMKVS